jgi:hypothetical protein
MLSGNRKFGSIVNLQPGHVPELLFCYLAVITNRVTLG